MHVFDQQNFLNNHTLELNPKVKKKSNHRLYKPMHIAMRINQCDWNATAQQNTKIILFNNQTKNKVNEEDEECKINKFA